MRRRRKKFQWFPVLPTLLSDQPGATWFNQETVISHTQEPGQVLYSAINIVDDETINTSDTSAQVTLRDRTQGQDYVLERLVGRVWGTVGQGPAINEGGHIWTQMMLAFGVAVMPYEETDTLALSPRDIDPLGADNSDDSWIYRGIFPLWNNTAQSESPLLGPTNVGNCGPDYGFVDTRSVRRISKDERLTLVMSLHLMSAISGAFAADQNFSWGYDFRLLGAMRRGRTSSTFR